MRNQRGIAPIFIILTVVALVSVGALFVLSDIGSNLVHKNKLTDSQKKDVEKAKVDLQDFAAVIDAAQGLGLSSDQMESLTDSVIEERKKQIQNEAQEILAKDTCEALMIDIENALKLASDAWLATDEETGNALWEWARTAYRGYVVDAAMAVGATFLEQDLDLYSIPYEERKILYAKSREIFYDRAMLAQQAQLFGFEDIHDKILKGEFLEPVCVQLWNVKTEVEYSMADEFMSTVEHWKMGVNIEDTPIYKYHPRVALPEIREKFSKQGYLDIIEMYWREASDSPLIYSYTKENEPWWTLSMEYEENKEDFWHDVVDMSVAIDISKPDVSVCSDYAGCGPLRSALYNGKIKMEVPALKLWQRKPFVFEEEKDGSDEVFNEKIINRVEFTPSKRVKVSELL